MNGLIYKTEAESQIYRMNLQLPKGKGGGEGGIKWESGIDIYTSPYLKQITNKDLLYSTGNSAQYSGITYRGKEFEKEQVYAYGQLNHFAIY